MRQKITGEQKRDPPTRGAKTLPIHDSRKTLLEGTSFLHPDVAAALGGLGFLKRTQAILLHIVSRVVWSKRSGRPCFIGVETIASDLGLESRHAVDNAVRRSDVVYRAGSVGQRRRPWIVKGINDEDALTATNEDMHFNTADGGGVELVVGDKSRLVVDDESNSSQTTNPTRGKSSNEKREMKEVGRRKALLEQRKTKTYQPTCDTILIHKEHDEGIGGALGASGGSAEILNASDDSVEAVEPDTSRLTTPEGLADGYHAAMRRAGYRRLHPVSRDHRYASKCLDGVPRRFHRNKVLGEWIVWYFNAPRAKEALWFTRFSASWADFEPTAKMLVESIVAEERARELKEREVRDAAERAETDRRRLEIRKMRPSESDIRAALEPVPLPETLYSSAMLEHMRALVTAVPNVRARIESQAMEHEYANRIVAEFEFDADTIFRRLKEFVVVQVTQALESLEEADKPPDPSRMCLLFQWKIVSERLLTKYKYAAYPKITKEQALYRSRRADNQQTDT